MIIFGITGTLGAGKGTIVEYLTSKYNFEHYSVRAFLVERIEEKGLPVNRDSMVVVANELRASQSPSFIIDELYKKAVESGKNCIIESIRTPGEVDSLRKKENFWLIAVDANAKVRYERITARKSETDNVSFDAFVENEKREMTSSDPNKQNLSKCIEMADFVIDNSGSLYDLQQKVEAVLKKI
jgi:dephospho-CoA kinase